MRIIIILFVLIAPTGNNAISQAGNKKAASSDRAVPSKNEIQSQMNEATNELKKQVVDLKKQLKETTDPEEKEALQEQITMLEKQLSMMQGLNKNLSAMSDKTIQEGFEEEEAAAGVPKKDEARINSLPKKILNDAELVLHIKSVFSEIEKIIPAAERMEAAKMYNAAKSEWKSANALNSSASSCWMFGHQAKAIWITGKACIDFPGNADLLDNYSAFLTMTGAEQAAIPILLYLNNGYPNNSTILNNLGQAWFGLGDEASAKKYLESATELYPAHSMANLTLGRIYSKGESPDEEKAMAAFKMSMKESFCTDKKNLIKELGGNVSLDDLPDFNYPVESNPFLFENLLSIIPDNQSSVDEYIQAESQWQGYLNALKDEIEKSRAEELKQGTEILKFGNRLSTDIPYQGKILYAYHHSPSHSLAKEYLYALAVQGATSQSNPSIKLNNNHLSLVMLSTNISGAGKTKPISMPKYVKTLSDLCEKELIQPLEQLEKNRQGATNNPTQPLTCEEVDALNNKFLADVKNIQAKYKQKFRDKYNELKKPFDMFVSISGYAGITPTVADRDMDDIVIDFFANKVNPSYLSEIGKPPFEHRPMFSLFLSTFYQLTEHRATKDRCKSETKKITPTQVKLPQLKQPDIPNKYTIDLLGIKIHLEWGRMIFDESKLKKRSEGETKGSGVSSKQQSNQHVSLEDVLGHGPHIQNDIESLSYGPLVAKTLDEVDATYSYIEFDKYGNFSDFKLPLNEDGTKFADAFSNEKFDQRRWSWIACPSGREKILKGLFKKP